MLARMVDNPDASTREAADPVLIGGPCYTADAARSWTSGIAVRTGVIIALGVGGRGRADARSMSRSSARVVLIVAASVVVHSAYDC